jgi:predicted MFS family arabinose efflux permease
MFDTIMQHIASVLAVVPFGSATWFVLFVLSFFVWLFAKASKNPTNPVEWEHLVIDSSNNRASPYKTGFLVGLIVGTWIVLSLADKDKLTFDIFGMYLTYLLGGAGVNSFVKKGIDSTPSTPSDGVDGAPPSR